MDKMRGVCFAVIIAIFLFGLTGAGCQPETEDLDAEVQEEQELSIQAEGQYVGQIDSQFVEIEVDGRAEAFGLATGMDVSDIKKGSLVSFTYEDHGDRPTLQSIEVIEEPAEEVFQNEGIYVGRIDSRSVEIEVDGKHSAFAVESEELVEDLIDGSIINFTFKEGEHRPVLLSVVVIEEPDLEEDGEKQQIDGEGVFVGQIDSQSIEVLRIRAFVPGEGVGVEDIADGSKVVFRYSETGERPILDHIEVVDSPPEGAVRSGRFVGWIDNHSVEIEYEQAFTLRSGVCVEDISDGAEINFTYREGPARPIIVSISFR